MLRTPALRRLRTYVLIISCTSLSQRPCTCLYDGHDSGLYSFQLIIDAQCTPIVPVAKCQTEIDTLNFMHLKRSRCT